MSATSASWAVITGASAGIGAACLRRIAQYEPNLNCLAVGRRLNKLQEAKQLAGGDERVHLVAADVSTSEGIATIVSALPANASVKYLIHNAGLLGPIAPLAEIDRDVFRQVMATNLEAPLFLTQALLPHLKRCASETNTKARILHVSSGAAHSSYEGWGSYCVTKAGFNMMYRCLATELAHDNILVGSVRPGVVDTPMQNHIREFKGPSNHFPARSKFLNLHESGKLENPENVAAYFHWLLSDVIDEEYVSEEWDIRNSTSDTRFDAFRSAVTGS
jgi:benzil reductase ((S)-benzoin forming)